MRSAFFVLFAAICLSGVTSAAEVKSTAKIENLKISPAFCRISIFFGNLQKNYKYELNLSNNRYLITADAKGRINYYRDDYASVWAGTESSSISLRQVSTSRPILVKTVSLENSCVVKG